MTEQKHFDPVGHLVSDTVAEVIDERVKVYGDPTVTFPQIAQVWSGYLGHEIKPEEVPMMMILMKSVRARQAPDYSDNTDDIEGYLDIYRKLVPNMIHARSVDEYIEKKFPVRVQEAALEPRPFVDSKVDCLHRGYHSIASRHTRAECPVGDKDMPVVDETGGHERQLYTSTDCICGEEFGSPEDLATHLFIEIGQ